MAHTDRNYRSIMPPHNFTSGTARFSGISRLEARRYRVLSVIVLQSERKHGLSTSDSEKVRCMMLNCMQGAKVQLVVAKDLNKKYTPTD